MSRYLQIANVRNNAQAFVTGSKEILAEKNAFQPGIENSPQQRIRSISHMYNTEVFDTFPQSFHLSSILKGRGRLRYAFLVFSEEINLLVLNMAAKDKISLFFVLHAD